MQKIVLSLRKLFFLVIIFTFQLEYAQSDIWRESNGATIGGVKSLAVNTNNVIFAYGDPGKFARSTNNGNSWSPIIIQGIEYFPLTNIVAVNNNVYVAINNLGVYKSTDDGETWEQKNVGLTNLQIRCIWISNNGELFLGSGGNIFKSNNGGETWDYVGSVPANHWIYALATGENNNFFASTFIGTFQGLLRSIDGGQNWETVYTNSEIRTLNISSNGYIYAGGSSGLIRSTNNGNSWQVIESSIQTDRAIYIDSNDYIFFSKGGGNGIIKSTDYGENWISFGLTGKAIMSIAKNNNGDFFAGHFYTGIYRTTNNGLIWTVIYNSGIDFSVEKLYTNSNGFVYAKGSNRRVYFSNDNGEQWNKNDTLPVGDLGINSNNILFCVGINNDIYRSTDYGYTWTFLKYFGSLEAPLKILCLKPASNIFIQQYLYSHILEPGPVFRSTNNGETWDNVGFNGISIKTIEYSAEKIFFASSSGNIFRSTNGGTNWHPVNTGIKGTINNFYKSEISNFIYAVGDSGVFRSTDLVTYWEPKNNGLTSVNVLSFVLDGSRSFYCGTTEGLFISNNEGDLWSSAGLENLSIKSITLNVNNSIFVNTNDGIYYSINDGNAWNEFNSGLPNKNIPSFLINTDGFGFVISNSKVYRTSLTISAITYLEDQNFNIPIEFKLLQNYPNPFNPTTTIKIVIPKSLFVNLKVYDILGTEVATLVNEEKPAGSYEVEFNGSSISSGIYFYKLQTENYTEVKKMILLR